MDLEKMEGKINTEDKQTPFSQQYFGNARYFILVNPLSLKYIYSPVVVKNQRSGNIQAITIFGVHGHHIDTAHSSSFTLLDHL